MKRISMIDDLFLRLESRRQPFHIGLLLLFEADDQDPLRFTHELAQTLFNSTELQAPFNKHLRSRRGLHYWAEDTEFDLAQHFVHLSLPAPGRIRELLSMVSRVHSQHLDRAYPLWRIYLIEGIEDGRFALYIKMHHSLIDGVSGMKMLMKGMSPDREKSRHLPPFWEIPLDSSKPKVAVASSTFGAVSAIRKISRRGIKALPPLMKELRSNLTDLWQGNPDFVVAGQAPKSIFNQAVSASRRFAAQSYDAARIHQIAQAYNATTNDVVMAMCGSALRRYLLDLNELPEKPLIAGIPISIRREDSADFGNEVAFTLAHLGTDLDDPVERLLAIKNCMDYSKAHLRKLSPGETLAATAVKMIPGALNTVLRIKPDQTLGNVVISHVPGPKTDLYWQGAKLSGMYPVSLLTDGGALNITLVSRHNSVDFGIIACRKAVPQVQRLLQYLEDALTELEETL